MAKPVAIITADWHLRKHDRIWPRRPTIVGDASWGMQQIESLVASTGVKHIIILGDIFNERILQSDTVTAMRALLTTFAASDVQVSYIQGQHERATPPWLCAIHSQPVWLHQQLFNLSDSIRIYGLDYQTPYDVREALSQVPKAANVLATHQVWKDLLTDDSGDAWFTWVPEHVQLILTGDYHVHCVRHDDYGRTVVSPGPLCIQKIDETGPHGVWLLHDDLTVTSQPLQTRQSTNVVISTAELLDAFVREWPQNAARLPQVGAPADVARGILRVHYLASLPAVRERIERAVGTDVHLFWQPSNPRTPQDTIEEQARVETVLERGMPGCIREFYGDNAAACSDAIRLWQSEDLRGEIETIVQERLG